MLRPAFQDVALDAAEQANIRVHLHVQLQEHQLHQPRVKEAVDALQNHHIVRVNQLIGVRTAVLRVVIRLAGDGLTADERVHVVQQQIVVKNAGFVVIELCALGKGQIRMVAVVAILLDDQTAVAQPVRQRVRQGGFSAAACAADANQNHRSASPCISLQKSTPKTPRCQGEQQKKPESFGNSAECGEF